MKLAIFAGDAYPLMMECIAAETSSGVRSRPSAMWLRRSTQFVVMCAPCSCTDMFNTFSMTIPEQRFSESVVSKGAISDGCLRMVCSICTMRQVSAKGAVGHKPLKVPFTPDKGSPSISSWF